jgi:hypothetical protein
MKKIINAIVALVLALTPAVATAQQALDSAAEANVVRQMATALGVGVRVKVQTKAGQRMTATLMAIGDDAIVLKRDSRVPEPAVEVRFADVARLQREERGGLSVAKAIGIGLAAGAGAILTLFAIAVSVSD